MSESKKESIAQQLRAARRAKGGELEDAHRATGVSLLVLEGLESGKNDVVEPVFTRLALGTYADYLGLDAALLAQFDAEQGPVVTAVPNAESQSAASLPAAPVLDAGVLRLIGMVAGALVILLIVISILDGEESVGEVEDVPAVRVEPAPASTLPPLSEEPVPTTATARAASESVQSNSANLAAAVAAEEVVIPPAETATSLIADGGQIGQAPAEPEGEADAVMVDGSGAAQAENEENVSAIAGGERGGDSGDLSILAESAAVVTGEEQQGNSLRQNARPGADEIAAVAVGTALVLEVEAVDSTWVQVNWDEAGVFQGIVPRGERRTWRAQEYFRVHSGRAHGLRYWFQGQLLGGGTLGDATKVLRFRASAEGLSLLDSNLKLLEFIAQP